MKLNSVRKALEFPLPTKELNRIVVSVTEATIVIKEVSAEKDTTKIQDE